MPRMLRSMALAAAFFAFSAAQAEPSAPMPIWPQGEIPDAVPAAGPQSSSQTHLIAGKPVTELTNVSDPTITLFRPDRESGAAVLVFPGGAYRVLAYDLEGTEVCRWLNSIDVTCVLLKYRVPDSGPYPKSNMALDDAERAIGLVREHAAEWGIDPHRIGALGFSAGAHLVAALSTHFGPRLYKPLDAADAQSDRPDFSMIVYPGYVRDMAKGDAISPDLPVTAETPPAFLIQAENDPVHVENAIAYFLALKAAGVPAEMHLYAEGGHGYGLRRTDLPITDWPKSAEIWLHTIGALPKAAGQP